jgi:dienelactone hydrolase
MAAIGSGAPSSSPNDSQIGRRSRTRDQSTGPDGADQDSFFLGEGDIDAAREIVASIADAALFLYPGDQHYFADSALPSYDPVAASLLTRRVLDFLARA